MSDIVNNKTINELVKITVGEMSIFDGQNEPLIIDCTLNNAIKKVENSIYNNKKILYLGCSSTDEKQWIMVKVEV